MSEPRSSSDASVQESETELIPEADEATREMPAAEKSGAPGVAASDNGIGNPPLTSGSPSNDGPANGGLANGGLANGAPGSGGPDTDSWWLAPAQWPEGKPRPAAPEPQPAASAPAAGAAAPPAAPATHDLDDDGPATQLTPQVHPTPTGTTPATPPPTGSVPTGSVPTGSVPTGEYRPPAGPPSRIYVPRPVAYDAPPSQPIMMPPPPRVQRRRGPWLYAVISLVVVAVVAGLGIWGLQQRKGNDPAPPKNTTSTEAAVFQGKLSSFSVKDSGFRQDGTQWVTQTYTTPLFGGLKPGAGLVLDLGAAQRVTRIDFTADTPGLTADLRYADSEPSTLDGWKKEGSAKTASGAASFPVTSSGKHRYWMIWVTRLGTGNKAAISNVSARGIK